VSTVRTTTFPAWGTYVFLATRRPAELPHALTLAAGILHDVDRTCSRFRDDTDLARANARAGHWVSVDPLLVAAVGVACEAARQTDGLVNPLLGRPLVQLGYDRDLSLLTDCEDDEVPVPSPVPTPELWQDIGLDPEGALRVPAGTALDLGATAKAWTADLVAAALAAEVDGPALISIGGDLAIASPDGVPWPVAISTRPGAAPETTVALGSGGLATSSTRVRRWTRRGVRRHHLLDPRTGLPVPERWHTVTATGPTCTAANTATTAALVLGPAAPAWLERHDVTARLVAPGGRVRTTGSWPSDGPEQRRSA
jgi:thiamine biosynthesis lipoprotein